MKLINIDGKEMIVETLTDQQIRVMDHVGQGLTTKEIAKAIGISVHTVSTHIRVVCSKVGQGGRWAALVRARQMGLMPV